MTVYYNSRHPDEAVLERDLPKGLWGCLGIGTAIVVAVVFGAAIGLQRIRNFSALRLANPQIVVVPVVGAGRLRTLVAALFALALRRQSAQAKKPPVVPGTIKTVGLDEYRTAPDKAAGAAQMMYRAQSVVQL